VSPEELLELESLHQEGRPEKAKQGKKTQHLKPNQQPGLLALYAKFSVSI